MLYSVQKKTTVSTHSDQCSRNITIVNVTLHYLHLFANNAISSNLHILLRMCFSLTLKTSVQSSKCFSIRSVFSSSIPSRKLPGSAAKHECLCELWPTSSSGGFWRIGEGEDLTQEHANSENITVRSKSSQILSRWKGYNIGQTVSSGRERWSLEVTVKSQWNDVQGGMDSFLFTFLKALNSCLCFFFFPLSCVLRDHAFGTCVFLCVQRVSLPEHHCSEAMWNEIYQSQWSIVMKTLWGNFSHACSQGPGKVVNFLPFFDENNSPATLVQMVSIWL